jgi:DNA topoisomerase 2-associated protein PAT1
MLEGLYDVLVEIETLDRRRPPNEEVEAFEYWYELDFPSFIHSSDHIFRSSRRDKLIEQLWDQLQVTVPLEAWSVLSPYQHITILNEFRSDPHPFISLLMPAKGKRLLSRLTKYLGQRNLLLLTLLVALFPQVDVVAKAPLLDSVEPSELRTEIETQTAAWLDAVPGVILAAVTQASLAHISSWFAMLLERTNIVKIASTQVIHALFVDHSTS